MTASHPIHRPADLTEALHALAAAGGWTHAAPGPQPLLLTPAGVLLDLSRVAERGGVHQLGGRLLIGLNVGLAELARASLVQTQAACLAEAAEQAPDAGLSLALSLAAPDRLIPLALSALDAEIELAELGEGGEIRRRWQGLALFRDRQSALALPLALRFARLGRGAGSALARQTLPPGMLPSLHAAAAALRLEGERIAAAALAILPAAGPPRPLPQAAAALIGLAPAAALDQIGERARVELAAALPPPPPDASFYVDLSAHLLRQALARALARAAALF